MARSWKEQRERGSGWLVYLGAWLVLSFGRGFGRLLMLPISLYFALFSQGTAKASRNYLEKALRRRARVWHVFKHYLTFSITIMDRLYFLTDRSRAFQFDVKGDQHLQDYIDAGKGCILLGAHLGSFEALRTLGFEKKGLSVKALYYEYNSQQFDGLLRKLNPKVDAALIRMGSPHSMLEVKEFVDRGGMVGILGDRSRGNDKICSVEFLGQPAAFPIWPFRLAAAIGAPIVLFFGLYLGGRRYEIIFEPFTEAVTRDQLRDPIQTKELVREYAGRIEHHCLRAPYNWFNFFDFWHRPAGAVGGAPSY